MPGRVGGSEEYLVRQLLGLRTVAPDITVRLALAPALGAAHPDLVDGVGRGAAARVRPTPGRFGRIAAESLWLPRQVDGADVVHHGGGTIAPGRRRSPVVLTVHDLQYRELPHHFSTARLRYLAWTMPRSVKRADVVAVPSAFVPTQWRTHSRSTATEIVVVPHGVDPPRGPIEEPARLRERYGLGDRRVLVYPAITHPHKRHRFLVELLAGPWGDRDLVLVLLGGRGAADDGLTAAIERAGVGHRVRATRPCGRRGS